MPRVSTANDVVTRYDPTGGSLSIARTWDDYVLVPEADPTPERQRPALQEIFRGISVLSRQAARSVAHVAAFTREIRRQSSGVDASLKATRGSVGPETVTATADHLRSELVDAVAAAMRAISGEMQRIEARIDAKAKEASRFVAFIDQIGSTVRILSLNATIEATRAGRHGQGFVAIAAEVRDLANQTTESARDAAVVIDFKDVRSQLAEVRDATDSALASLEASIQNTAGQIETLLGSVGTELAAISASNASIDEALAAMQSCIDRTETKTERTHDLATAALQALAYGGCPPDIASYGLANRAHDVDLLDGILKKGHIRIAIEPDFKGLSFRKSPDTPLVGLDVAYAEAFAKYLGVAAVFVETPWDQCTELLDAGRTAAEQPVDIVWSALPPNAEFGPIAYSKPYTYLHFVLARRKHDRRITGLKSLDGRRLGIINDPNTYAVLQKAGIRWSGNMQSKGDCVATVGSLLALTDQSRIHDALASGLVDAFAVDAPILYWACVGADSPWRDRIEILPGNLAESPWYYAAAVADHPCSCRLLMAADAFIGAFLQTEQRRMIENTWQGGSIFGKRGYQEEPGALRGSEQMIADYRRAQQRAPVLPPFGH